MEIHIGKGLEPDIWFEVQHVYNRVQDVNFGVLIDDESDEYIWPSPDLGWLHNVEA